MQCSALKIRNLRSQAFPFILPNLLTTLQTIYIKLKGSYCSLYYILLLDSSLRSSALVNKEVARTTQSLFLLGIGHMKQPQA